MFFPDFDNSIDTYGNPSESIFVFGARKDTSSFDILFANSLSLHLREH